MLMQDIRVAKKRRIMGPNCSGFCHNGLGTLPVITVAFTSLSFIITYIISVNDGDVYPYFPTISDTGGTKPESNVFSVLLSCSSFLIFLVAWTRFIQYRHISEYNDTEHSRILLVNKIAFGVAVFVCFGALVVAGFQDRGISTEGHYAGALAVFGGGIIYGFLQCYLSYSMLRCGMNTIRLCLLRLFLTILATVALLTFFITFDLSMRAYGKNKDYSHWQPKDKGFVLHVIGSICEWLCAGCMLLFFLTFTNEFNQIKIEITVRRQDLNILPFQTSVEEPEQIPYA